MTVEQGYQGYQPKETFTSKYNAQYFIIQSILSAVHTAALVQVVNCTNSGGVTAVGTVDVRPLVNMLDGYGNQVPHGVIYGCPYFRMQGGANAVILDPQPGDIGIAVFAENDISGVIKNKTASNPGSNRNFDMSDGIYFGGMLNGVPSQFVQFGADGITITSPTLVTINANVHVNGAIVATGNMTAGNIDLENHTHGGVTTGTDHTGAPTG